MRTGARLLLAAGALAVAAGGARAAAAVGAGAQESSVRILLLGDSLTAGYYNGGKSWHPYGPVLEERLGCPVKYIGLSGWTTWGLYEQRAGTALGVDDRGRQMDGLETTLMAALAEKHPFTHVAILAGTNDMWSLNPQNGPHRTIENLRALHTTAHQRGAITLALTVPPLGVEDHREEIAKGRAEVNRFLARYARESHGRTLLVDLDAAVPMFGVPEEERRRRYEDDGIHFTPAGSEEIAAAVAAVLAKDSTVQAVCPGAA